MWPIILKNAKAAGVDVIEAYVFWDTHQATRDSELDFTGNKDLVRFVKECQKQGLYVNLRIGPYVCAEWANGVRSVKCNLSTIVTIFMH